jgi:nitroimidazol reductase NimA-like FMN-containing flavoprotein (pyridoxamine 5'-phosphate oxidase superfamily)
MSIQQKKSWLGICMVLMVLLCAVLYSYAAESEQQKQIKAGAGETGAEATIVQGPPLKADQVLTKDHPQYARGMACVECHKVAFDGVTTSTKQFMLNFPQLKNAAVWKKIEAFLPGRERFVLTTVYNNEPTATTIDMVLDKDQKVLYAVCEKGTEKLFHMKKNPSVCAVHYEGWTVAGGGKKEWKSVQVKGTAEVISSSDKRFTNLLDKYHLVRVSKVRAPLRFDIVKLTPTKIVYFDTNLAEEKAGVYQLWKREK